MRTLLIRPGAIGDFILSLPALQHLACPDTEIWCATPNVALARRFHPARSIQSSGLNDVAILPATRAFQALAEFDRIYSWYGANQPDFRAAVAHLPFTFFQALPPRASKIHATKFYCNQVDAPDSIPCIETPLTPRRAHVVLHPFASSPAKQWPLTSFRELASRVPHVEWCAAPGEPLDQPEVLRVDDLFDLAFHLATAAAYVGSDSGITHLAAAVGTPTVALFGPTDPAIWAPRGSGIRVLRASPLSSISAAHVLAELKNLL